MKKGSPLTFVDLATGEVCEKPDASLVIAIGNFDGVHLGHRKLISEAVKRAEMLPGGTKSGVFFFEMPPADYFSDCPPEHISSVTEKLTLFSALGVRYAIVCDFAQVKDLSPDEFIALLRGKCSCTWAICGFNFRFGRGGKGSADTIKEYFGERALVIDAVRTDDGEVISSSRIRKLVKDGQIEEANRLLGRPFALEGEVLHGKALGRKLGVPTVNMNFEDKMLIPKTGVYVSVAKLGGKAFPAVTNIGARPSVETGGAINCETHLLGYSGDVYGERIRIELLLRIRDEKKFSSEEELKGAIEADRAFADRYFRNE